MTRVGDDRNLLDQRYPIELARHVCHQLRRPRHNSRTRWVHRPNCGHVSSRDQIGASLSAPAIWRSAEGKEKQRRLDGTYLWKRALGENTVGSNEHHSVEQHMCCIWTRTYMSKQVLPQAPSPTMTSLRRISAMLAGGAVDEGSCDNLINNMNHKRYPRAGETGCDVGRR